VIYRKLSPTGDYTFGSPQGSGFYTGTSAVAQAVYTSLRLLQGEWWEDTSLGLPLFQSLVGLPGTPENQRAVDLIVQAAILDVPGVTGIASFLSVFSPSTRTYTVTSCQLTTEYGNVGLQEVTFGGVLPA
jgi:hypothetical protein